MAKPERSEGEDHRIHAGRVMKPALVQTEYRVGIVV